MLAVTASPHPLEASPSDARPSRAEAEAAVRVLIRWAGDDPARPGLLDTPDRVLRSFDEAYSGYRQDPAEILAAASSEAHDQDMVIVRGIRFASRSDENMVPLIGDAMVAYVPAQHAVDAAAIGNAIDALSRRLQNPGTIAAGLAAALNEAIRPLGAAVFLRTVRVAAVMSGSAEAAMAVDSAFVGVLRMQGSWRARLGSLILEAPPIRIGPGGAGSTQLRSGPSRQAASRAHVQGGSDDR